VNRTGSGTYHSCKLSKNMPSCPAGRLQRNSRV